MDIAVEGRRVFEILELFQDKPCLEATARSFLWTIRTRRRSLAPAEVMRRTRSATNCFMARRRMRLTATSILRLAYAIAEDLPIRPRG